MYVEEKDYESELFQVEAKGKCDKIRKFYTSLSSLSDETCFQTNPDTINEVDLIITLGGDGTILYASTLFQVNTYIYIRYRHCVWSELRKEWYRYTLYKWSLLSDI